MRYRLENLPSETFVLGIQLTSSRGAPALSEGAVSAEIDLLLQDESGRTLLHKSGNLSEWTWSLPASAEWAFVYGSQPQGTYFTPVDGSSLSLVVTVSQAGSLDAAYSPRLVAKAGGWK
jgi:hypothetical protein